MYETIGTLYPQYETVLKVSTLSCATRLLYVSEVPRWWYPAMQTALSTRISVTLAVVVVQQHNDEGRDRSSQTTTTIDSSRKPTQSRPGTSTVYSRESIPVQSHHHLFPRPNPFYSSSSSNCVFLNFEHWPLVTAARQRILRTS